MSGLPTSFLRTFPSYRASEECNTQFCERTGHDRQELGLAMDSGVRMVRYVHGGLRAVGSHSVANGKSQHHQLSALMACLTGISVERAPEGEQVVGGCTGATEACDRRLQSPCMGIQILRARAQEFGGYEMAGSLAGCLRPQGAGW